MRHFFVLHSTAVFLTAYSMREEHVGDHMNDVVRYLCNQGLPVVDLCRAVLRDGTPPAKAGARELLAWLGVDAA